MRREKRGTKKKTNLGFEKFSFPRVFNYSRAKKKTDHVASCDHAFASLQSKISLECGRFGPERNSDYYYFLLKQIVVTDISAEYTTHTHTHTHARTITFFVLERKLHLSFYEHRTFKRFSVTKCYVTPANALCVTPLTRPRR